jgi:hypothetical protein
MNTLFLSYLIQNNYLLKKEKNIYVKHLDVRGEHSVLSDWVCWVQVPLVPAGLSSLVGMVAFHKEVQNENFI